MDKTIFENYLAGNYKSHTEIQDACQGDIFLLGSVMTLIKNHKVQKVSEWRASIVPSDNSTLTTEKPRKRIIRKVKIVAKETSDEEQEEELPETNCLKRCFLRLFYK